MTDTQVPSKAETRAAAQRARILDAARKCFVEHGFHAASMANIADTAGMSAGLIYRYFASKNAIILGIVEAQLDVLRDTTRFNRMEDLADEFTTQYQTACTGEDHGMSAALLLEMSAEATRDAQIGDALSRFDATLRAAMSEWLQRSKDDGGHGLSADVAAQRALILQCLYEGLKVRATREPDINRDFLHTALDDVLGKLLTH
ncbi:MAG: helix-turn-helix domain-containing protein [Dokdonella sp.]